MSDEFERETGASAIHEGRMNSVQGVETSSVLEDIDERLRKILSERNIKQLHPVQEDVYRPIVQGLNVLVCAPTGIGKTEAAMLPVFQRMAASHSEGISCLYITPLRSLNRDMLLRLKQFAEAVGLRAAVRHGDTSQSERASQSSNPPDVLITTPETLQIMLVGRKLRKSISHTKFVVVDEIHELAGSERGAQLCVALERLANISGEFQRIGLSATVGSPDEIAQLLGGGRQVYIAKLAVERPREIKVIKPEIGAETVSLAAQLQIDEGFASVIERAKSIIDRHRGTLFFVNTRDLAEAIASRFHLWMPEYPAGVHHGSLSKELRVQMEEEFKKGELKCLICTSSLELGIDIGRAEYTIQFNSPRQVTRLLQRIGRAGHRAGEMSRGCILGYDDDELLEGAVIARRALAEELEQERVREKPLTVLANQIVAMASEGCYSDEGMYSTLLRSYPFRGLSRGEFVRVLDFLLEYGLVRRDEATLKRSMRGLHYFYENLSMIRDEKTYSIRDIGTRKIIGTLDEGFVVSFAEEGAIFITHGRSWRVIELRESEILVEPVSVAGALPSWIGEEIPVPYEVAQEVGSIRRTGMVDAYALDSNAASSIRSYIASVREPSIMAHDGRIVVEVDGRHAVINACFGTRVNETLSRLLAAMISARSGESVGIDSDPYRIVMELPAGFRKEWIAEALHAIKPEMLESFMEKVIMNLSYARWQFLYVGKKFGIIRKDADYREINIQKLMQSYEGTPVMEETVAKTMWESMDIAGTSEVLHRIQAGEIEVVHAPLSPVGEKGLEATREIYRPARADRGILEALKKRLLSEEFTLHCLHCGARKRTRAENERGRIVCWKCGGKMLAALGRYDEEMLSGRRKEEKKMRKNASLVMEYGQRALMVLAGRGIGPDAAARILGKQRLSEEQLLREILEQEINFARTKRFWD